jgi:response regulator RpfG family c-di-GMP phosphodiesterase
VADLTTALARIVDRAADGPYGSVTFSREDLRELSTAALLHDFGKISVPESILLKRAKLEPWSLSRIRDRFDFFLEAAEAADSRDLLHRLENAGAAPTRDDLRSLEETRAERARQLEGEFEEVRRSNEPTVLPKESGSRLHQLRLRTWRDRRGVVSPLLLEDELALLSIPKGSLSEEERTLIESHVSHTWRFLSSIPWTPDLARIPEIAYAHHEKLNGGGYPRRLGAAAIPLPSRILTVCDIYDALTASDRPYKRAVPREKALAILEDEARTGLLDAWLVETFVTEKVWLGLG